MNIPSASGASLFNDGGILHKALWPCVDAQTDRAEPRARTPRSLGRTLAGNGRRFCIKEQSVNNVSTVPSLEPVCVCVCVWGGDYSIIRLSSELKLMTPQIQTRSLNNLHF